MRAALAATAALTLFAQPVFAQEATDAPVSTARSAPGINAEATAPPPARTGGEISTADQIAAYLRTSPVLQTDALGAMDGIVGVGEPEDRKVHGVIDLSVGTNGYRNMYARTDIPVGETGNVSIAIQQGRNQFGWGPGWGGGGWGPGLGAGFGGPGFGGMGFGGMGYGGMGMGPSSMNSVTIGASSTLGRCRDIAGVGDIGSGRNCRRGPNGD